MFANSIEAVEVYRSRSRAATRENALVLAAMGIEHVLLPAEDGFHLLLVSAGDAGRAQDQLLKYARENRFPAREPRPPYRLVDSVIATMIAAALLVIIYAWSQQHAFFQDWLSRGAIQVGRMADGEWWRAVTALGLHADLGHLLSNLLFGSIFGVVLTQSIGPGLGWLCILVAGVAGNALNAAVHPAYHTAVGASTAVFAAVGLLSGLTWKRRLRWRRGLRRWSPVAGGLMLLAYLGLSGERTDIGAHVAGFLTGGALGVVLAYAYPRLPQNASFQRACGLSAVALFVLAWAWALIA